MSNFKIIAPTATTNLVTNPSFETGTTGWTTGGTNTIAQSSTQSKFGSYSLLCTYQDNAVLARFNSLTLTAAAYTASMWVWVDSAYSGTNLVMDHANFASATGESNVSVTVGTTNEWQRVDMTFTPDAGDLVGDIRILDDSGNVDANDFIYIDAVLVEQQSAVTTYCDGDQEGCQWAGQVHASQSTRPVTTRAGGLVKDFDDDYSFPIEKMIGTGVAPITNVTAPRALMPGADYQRHKVHPRQFSLISLLSGSTQANYHALRQALVNVLAPDGVPGEEAALLRYTGAAVDKEIRARYVSGLDLSGPRGYSERVGIVLQADDNPFWAQIGESSAALDVNDTATFRLVAARKDGSWDALGPPDASGTYVQANAVVVDPQSGSDVYFGGDFSNFDNDANADYIVRWDESADTWNALSTGLGGIVRDMAFGPDGTLYVVGDFTNAGGDADADYIAQWNGTAFSAVGTPATGASITQVEAVVVGLDGNVYVGGDFTNLDGDANADHIAYWDGSAWNAMGTGLDAACRALAVAPNGDIYGGGNTTSWGGTASNYVAYWDGTAWNAMTGLSTAGVCRSLAFDGAGNVYAGGSFNTAAEYLKVWNGQTWQTIGNSSDLDVNDIVWALVWRDNNLYVGGDFTTAGSLTTTTGMARWTGTSWVHLDIVIGSSADVLGIAFNDISGNMYVAHDKDASTGEFAGATTVTPAGTARGYPIITVKRSGGTSAKLETIINETTGASLFFDYDLLDGETLTIDLRPGSRSMSSSLFGERWDIIPSSDIAGFYLLPAANKITAFCDIAGAPTMTAFCRWRDSYWSID